MHQDTTRPHCARAKINEMQSVRSITSSSIAQYCIIALSDLYLFQSLEYYQSGKQIENLDDMQNGVFIYLNKNLLIFIDPELKSC